MIKLKPKTKSAILTYSGYGISTAAPLIATATQFPVFVQKGTGTTVSGVFVLVALICVLPIMLYIARLKKQNRTLPKPNTPLVIWSVILFACLALYNIIDELIIISASGAGGVVVSKVMFYFSEKQSATGEANSTEQVNVLLTEATNENRE